MAKKPNAQRVAWQEAARERIRFVVEKKFEGSQTELANALGVARSLISIVLRSVQPPTRNLMARLGTIPGINPRWAATGEGDAFGPDAHGTLPVSVGILPGWPERYPELLTGERCPVADAYSQQSRYWNRVDATCPALNAGLALLAGDMLLMDANSALWLDRLEQCVGRLFGVRVRRDAQMSYVLGLLVRDQLGLLFDLFGEIVRQAATRAAPSPEVHAKNKWTPRRRVTRCTPVNDEDQPESETTGVAKTSPEVQAPSPSEVPYLHSGNVVKPSDFTIDDIVAIRVGMYRT